MRTVFALSLFIAAAAIATDVKAADRIGIPACDEFIAKYEACLSSKLPEAQKTAFKSQLDQARQSWAELARNASAKPGLEATCKQTIEHVKTALQSYGCTF
jgi:hypothetical protein